MYVGRIVAIARTKDNKNCAMYRVSSRSFPNREARENDGVVSIMPRAGFEADLQKSPYIAYNCVRTANDYAVVTNGSHTDPIVEKIKMGMPPRDALALGLLAMDYEKDDYNTPRIAAVVHKTDNVAFLATIRHDAVHVTSFTLEAGQAFYVATYEHNTPSCHYMDKGFTALTAAEGCDYVVEGGVFAELKNPVTSTAVVASEAGFEIATKVI
ncbi:IMP cyclohydrolase [Lentisphaerota bacterium WC36G]|nr:IMP cyclohydrolase [Lentisphaerae bacterium WC36]